MRARCAAVSFPKKVGASLQQRENITIMGWAFRGPPWELPGPLWRRPAGSWFSLSLRIEAYADRVRAMRGLTPGVP